MRPEFCFGYGLSYTTFNYSDLEVEVEKEIIRVSVKVKNTGEREGIETIQIYIRDITASIVRPVKELKGFKKISLEPGVTEKVVIEIAIKDLGFYNDNYEYCLEEGVFEISAGSNVEKCLSIEQRIILQEHNV